MNSSPFNRNTNSQAATRRGVLLLIVLSLLTLFMMLGTTYLVVASRARATARAFAKVNQQSPESQAAEAERLLDQAFRILARGTTNTQNYVPPALHEGNDLLGDKYGSSSLANVPDFTDDPEGYQEYVRYQAFPLTLSQLPRAIPEDSMSPLVFELPVNLPGVPPECLPGRILTLELPGRMHCTRILAASGTTDPSDPQNTFTEQLTIAAASPNSGKMLDNADFWNLINEQRNGPSVGIQAYVNGREFSASGTNESFDAFDDLDSGTAPQNPFLAAITPSTNYDPYDPDSQSANPPTTPSKVHRISFQEPSEDPTTATVDNDADGVNDSKWIDIGLPAARMPDGTYVIPMAAFLVQDLDSRLNLNAHGSEFHWEAAKKRAQETENDPTGGRPLTSIPFGSSYGPADIRLCELFADSPGKLSLDEIDDLGTRVQQLFSGLTADDGRRRAEPPSRNGMEPIRPTIDLLRTPGRYTFAETAVQNGLSYPGMPAENDPLSLSKERGFYFLDSFAASLLDNWRAQRASDVITDFNSPSDLKGRLRIFADPDISEPSDGTPKRIVAPLVYTKPEWDSDTIDDPYELRLGKASVSDRPFAPADVERLLRIYDYDYAQQSTRSASLLGADAEHLRLLLTTESWDTTAISGETWRRVQEFLEKVAGAQSGQDGQDPPLAIDKFSPETREGRRIDLSRPLDMVYKPDPAKAAFELSYDDYDKQRLCEHLYTIACAVASDDLNPEEQDGLQIGPKQLAQWAVNVVDFIDVDSVMTVFNYDPDLLDGTWDDENLETVVGVERPEMVITEALAWSQRTDPQSDPMDPSSEKKGGFHVVLHMPWESFAVTDDNLPDADDTTAQSGDPDVIARELAVYEKPENAADNESATPTPKLALDRLSPDGDPAWRLRLLDGDTETAIIRLDSSGTASSPREYFSSENSNSTTDFQVEPGRRGWIHIASDVDTPNGAAITDGFPPELDDFLQIDSNVNGTAAVVPSGTQLTIVLERLANPVLELDEEAELLYVEIDRITTPVVDRTLQTEPGKTTWPRQQFVSAKRDARNFWQQASAPPAKNIDDINEDVSVSIKPLDPDQDPAPWLPFLNRPFTSLVELALVPTTDAASFLATDPTAMSSFGRLTELAETAIAQSNPSPPPDEPTPKKDFIAHLLESVTVGSRYLDTTVGSPSADYSVVGTGIENLLLNQLSTWREPGRVNLNTIIDDRVWNAVVRRGMRANMEMQQDSFDRVEAEFTLPESLPEGQKNSRSPPPELTPAEQLIDLLTLSTDSLALDLESGAPGPSSDLNPQFQYLTAGRLANVATTRSNVFAVWITLGMFEENTERKAPDAPRATATEYGLSSSENRRYRAFFLFDRSRPVGHITGRDLNLDDAILLRRIIQ